MGGKDDRDREVEERRLGPADAGCGRVDDEHLTSSGLDDVLDSLGAAPIRREHEHVSSTVKDLVAGSGLAFHDRGPYELKGIPGEWRLYAVDASSEVDRERSVSPG